MLNKLIRRIIDYSKTYTIRISNKTLCAASCKVVEAAPILYKQFIGKDAKFVFNELRNKGVYHRGSYLKSSYDILIS